MLKLIFLLETSGHFWNFSGPSSDPLEFPSFTYCGGPIFIPIHVNVLSLIGTPKSEPLISVMEIQYI